MGSQQAFTIKSEDDFYSFINTMMSKENLDSDQFDFPDIKFIGWPTININVKGDPSRYKSSITASMLFGIASLTEEIQRAYAVVRYGSQNLQRLTNADKQLLDIVYHISEGSSQANGTTEHLINGASSVFRAAIGRMTGRQALCAVVVTIIACSTVGWKLIDEYWKTQRASATIQAELVKASTGAVVESQKNALELLKTGQTSTSREILAHGSDGQAKFLKQLSQDVTVESVSIGNRIINREQLNTYNQRQSIDRVKITKTDEFYIKGVSRIGPLNQDISITVTNANTDDTFVIKTTSDVTTTNELKEFTDAVAQETLLTINYVEIRENNHISVGQLISIVPKS
ncbi:hypothetical protein [Xenorhabdus ishibashii]|uniref:Uncharacterized protein n=1 Tax=Xenorhabdus ishibashii TaxID=1034471 RepID=A0A2D0KHW5_9GAMM|nr:hypothetical protein [Xenorhabdus ishibashii]PHM63029.1 hypothetical protein Xish_02258 [Xenorhabdus ishibashii]